MRRGRGLLKPPLAPRDRIVSSGSEEVGSGTAEVFVAKEWNEYYDKYLDVRVRQSDSFRVYCKGWDRPGNAEKPVLFLIHGAGHSSMSWALFAQEIENVRIAAIDMRGHGATVVASDESDDYSAETLVDDVLAVLCKLVEQQTVEAKTGLVMCGHSMGGAIAIRACASALAEPLFPWTVQSLVVIDMVEGTAMHALPFMTQLIAQRPASFATLKEAYRYALSNSPFTCKNVDSLAVSLPSFLVKTAEERWVWRTDLKTTEPFWRGWFEGLSETFLARCKVPKLLILAGTDRLDTPLTVGQMQGKFQLKLLPWVGHVVQEDAPGATAQVVQEFIDRVSAPIHIAVAPI
ncbi:mitochondrial protein phosphatase methylesterase [Andalucia godoyi]|uniref:Protein phosphatase methylesterase 1 n=1 Tax=Andalucia godoyi TaxID=505711 RepID=A0A8K0AHC0_ANDGO|nr:mitochondrial protein phosphatase methylesterase [Andalucia godoyi]|eukprot:ANDGO_08396.mRNA.1 mitochondrial protein phosphatase methylesterase